MPNTTRDRRQYVEEKIKRWQDELQAIQTTCCHPTAGVAKIPRSNTGNYDTSADSYWFDCSCYHCGKRWTEPQ